MVVIDAKKWISFARCWCRDGGAHQNSPRCDRFLNGVMSVSHDGFCVIVKWLKLATAKAMSRLWKLLCARPRSRQRPRPWLRPRLRPRPISWLMLLSAWSNHVAMYAWNFACPHSMYALMQVCLDAWLRECMDGCMLGLMQLRMLAWLIYTCFMMLYFVRLR